MTVLKIAWNKFKGLFLKKLESKSFVERANHSAVGARDTSENIRLRVRADAGTRAYHYTAIKKIKI
jgi:hypothetical protein